METTTPETGQTPGEADEMEARDIEQADEPTPGEEQAGESDDADDDEEVWDRERSQRKIRKINAENKRLRERTKQAEEKAGTADELDTRNKALTRENLQLKVALELGLPMKLAERLQGDSREELVADAEQLIELVGPSMPKRSHASNAFGESRSNKTVPKRPQSLDEIAESFMKY